MSYECHRCGATDFAIDEAMEGGSLILEVMCRNCNSYQGELITP